MGIPVFEPYKDTEHKRLKTKLGNFAIQSFPIPHQDVENRGFIIDVNGQRICYMCDLEYCGWDLSKMDINVLILECNYIMDLVDEDAPNLVHKVQGHLELETCIGIIKMCQKRLHKVILVHMSKGATMDREKAMQRIREEIPYYISVEFAKSNTEYDLNEIPF